LHCDLDCRALPLMLPLQYSSDKCAPLICGAGQGVDVRPAPAVKELLGVRILVIMAGRAGLHAIAMRLAKVSAEK
jgi:hypothetical protein